METKRMDLMDFYDIQDTQPEKEFDSITQLAAQIGNTPVALISITAKNRKFVKSSYGLEGKELPPASIFGVIEQNNPAVPMVIADIRNEPLLAHHTYVLSQGFLFYATIPLVSPTEKIIGSLCVLDYKPSTLSDEQVHGLRLLADQVVNLMVWQQKYYISQQNSLHLREIEKMEGLDKANHEALINTTSDDIWSIDTEYRLIAFNKAFSEKVEILTGAPVSSGTHVLYPDKIPPDMYLQFKTYYKRALSGESFTDEYCRQEKLDIGPEIWIELNGNPIYRNGEITGAAFFARTITERKQAEIQTKQSEVNYRMLFESSPVPKILLNLETLHILEANKATLTKYGYQKQEIVGKSMGMLLREDEVYQFVESIQSLKGSGKETKLEAIVHRKKNGELIQGEMLVHELRFEGENCLLALINDQTEQLKTVSIRSQMASILENSLNEIYVFDTIELKFLYANRGALLNMGYTLEELKILTPFQIKPEFTENQFKAYIAPLLLDQKEQLVFTNYHERKDGSTYPVEVHLQKMWYEGQPAFVAFIIDITEAKESERQLQELNRLLEKSNDELEQFASITAHDLLEPLRMISGFTSLLEKKYSANLNEKGLKYLRFASDGSIRMQQMIKDILEYSRAASGVKDSQEFSLHDVLGNVVTDVQLLIRSTKANIHLPNADISLFGDKNAIYRLFLNLINNALKFIPEGKQPEITIQLTEDKQHYQFTVADNGIGIHPDHLHLLFKPYNRLNNRQKFEGTGLGLATCKKIVESHGGAIWVTSIPDSGSQFHFTLSKNQP